MGPASRGGTSPAQARKHSCLLGLLQTVGRPGSGDAGASGQSLAASLTLSRRSIEQRTSLAVAALRMMRTTNRPSDWSRSNCSDKGYRLPELRCCRRSERERREKQGMGRRRCTSRCKMERRMTSSSQCASDRRRQCKRPERLTGLLVRADALRHLQREQSNMMAPVLQMRAGQRWSERSRAADAEVSRKESTAQPGCASRRRETGCVSKGWCEECTSSRGRQIFAQCGLDHELDAGTAMPG